MTHARLAARALCVLALLSVSLGAVARAQTPRPAPRDTTPTAPSDSAARDSLVARILEQDSARSMRPAPFSLFGLDRLRLRTVGATAGWAWPGQAIGARVYSLHADYGEVYPGVRVVFVTSYWATRYKDDEVARLASEVRRAAGGPRLVDSVSLGLIRVADLSGGVEARWQPGLARRARAALRVVHPWVGGGVATHFVNVEGAPISGTFLERALDAAGIGLSTAVGLDLNPLPNFQATMQARYDFLSSVRYGSVRAGGSFIFGPSGSR